jgi:NADH:ubiquinone oxidoreductase subunit
MPESKTFSVNKDTVVRNGPYNQGCGLSKHIYAGHKGKYQYTTYIKFTLDWTDVRKINSAILNLYTDEFDTIGSAAEPGIFDAPTAKDTPRILIYRLKDGFSEGNNVDGDFDATDYTFADIVSTTKVGHTLTTAEKGANQLVQVNITSIVRAWAPSTVENGGRKDNFGIAIKSLSDESYRWSGWSSEHSVAAERPTITLSYELGPTTPYDPGTSNGALAPSGAVTSLTAFTGGFSDRRATDTLKGTYIHVFDAGHTATVAASGNAFTDSNHGLKDDDVIQLTDIASGGAGLSTFRAYYVVSAATNTFKVSTTKGGSPVDVTSNGTVTWSKKVWDSGTVPASDAERTAYAFSVPPVGWSPDAGVTYRWRVKYVDQEGEWSAWTGLTSFNTTNTPPDAPILLPVSGTSIDTMSLQKFRSTTFTDPDNDTLLAHQIQMSALAPGNPGWDDATNYVWDTGRTEEPAGATAWEDLYGGRSLDAGTYYWRARVWDSREGVSDWTYATLVLTAPFSTDPSSYDNVQANPQAPWRIVIRDLYQSDGVTKTTGRGPGRVVAVLEEAKNVGASIVYNSPGEIHFTLLKNDPWCAVIEPRQVHYAVEFYSGDGWQEKYAGVVWDVDATDTDLVFKGIDYLALWDTCIDERYDPLKSNKSYKNNGSYYSNVTLRTVILDQLKWAHKQPDSWVGFIKLRSANICAMDEKVTVYSTMQPTLSFITGLIDSHRQGSGKRTRISVKKNAAGEYELHIVDDPGIIRSDLSLHYGEMVQGYRLIYFGDNWANVQHVIGRNRDGVKVVYKTIKGKAFQPSTTTYGRIANVSVMDGVQDAKDLERRGLQAAIVAAKLGKQIALGIRTQYLAPLTGWDVTDLFPITIQDEAVDTTHLGSGYWAAMAAAWEATDIGQQSLVITFLPREDASTPNPDLLPSDGNISTQPEWQLGWTPPDPLVATSKFFKDQSTGQVYVRNDDNTVTYYTVTGTA